MLWEAVRDVVLMLIELYHVFLLTPTYSHSWSLVYSNPAADQISSAAPQLIAPSQRTTVNAMLN